MFVRLAQWILEHSKQPLAKSTSPKGEVRMSVITADEAVALEAIMQKNAQYYMICKRGDDVITLVNDMDFKTLLNELRELANADSNFRNELTNLVIDLNR